VADSFQIEVATPERLLVNEQARTSQIPTPKGYIGVLPDHAPLISELGIGVLSFEDTHAQRFVLAVSGGFIEIHENHVRVVADSAEFGNEVKQNEAEQQLRTAEQEMMHPAPDADSLAAVARYKHAQARLDAAREGTGQG